MSLHWSEDLSARDNTARELPKLLKEYFRAGHQAMQPNKSWEELHEFRLDTKRLRYTLELFRSAYGPGLRTRLAKLQKIQKFMGDMNDAVTVQGLLKEIPEAAALYTALGEKAEHLTQKLRNHWNTEFAAPGELEQWTEYLRNYPFRRSRGKGETGPEIGEA